MTFRTRKTRYAQFGLCVLSVLCILYAGLKWVLIGLDDDDDITALEKGAGFGLFVVLCAGLVYLIHYLVVVKR